MGLRQYDMGRWCDRDQYLPKMKKDAMTIIAVPEDSVAGGSSRLREKWPTLAKMKNIADIQSPPTISDLRRP